MLICDPR